MDNPITAFLDEADRLELGIGRVPPHGIGSMQAVGHIIGRANVGLIREAGYPEGAIVPWTVEDVCIYPIEEILSRQTGYRTDLDGAELAGWDASHWVVADWAGDPFTVGPDHAIHHARHGTGRWEHRRMFADLATFFAAMTVWIEFFIGANAGNILDGNFAVRADARADLEARLAAMPGDMDRDAFVRLACE